MTAKSDIVDLVEEKAKLVTGCHLSYLGVGEEVMDSNYL